MVDWGQLEVVPLKWLETKKSLRDLDCLKVAEDTYLLRIESEVSKNQNIPKMLAICWCCAL